MALISDFRRQIQPFNPLDGPNPVASGLAAFKAVTDEGRAEREEKRRDADQRLQERQMALEESLFPLKMKEAENALSMFGLDVQMKNAQITNQSLRTRELSRGIDEESAIRSLLETTLSPSMTPTDEGATQGTDFLPEPLSENEFPDLNAPLPDALPMDGGGEDLGPDVLTSTPLPENELSQMVQEKSPVVSSFADMSSFTGRETLAPVGIQEITPTVRNMAATRTNPLDKLDQKERDIATEQKAWVEGLGNNSRYRSFSPKGQQTMVAAGILNFNTRAAVVNAERNALGGALFGAMPEPYRDETRMAMQFGMEPTKALSTVSRFMASDKITQDLNQQGNLASFTAFAEGIKQPAFTEDETFGRPTINETVYRTWLGASAKEKAATAAVGEARKVSTDEIATLQDSLKVLLRVESGSEMSIGALAGAPASSRGVAQAQRRLYETTQRLEFINNGVPLAQVPLAAARQTMIEGANRLRELDTMPATPDREKGAEAQAIGAEYGVPMVQLAEGVERASGKQIADAAIVSISQSLGIPVPTDGAAVKSLLGQFNGLPVRVVGPKGEVRAYETLSFGVAKPKPEGVKTLADEEAEESDASAPAGTPAVQPNAFDMAAESLQADSVARKDASKRRAEESAKAKQIASVEAKLQKFQKASEALNLLEQSEGQLIPNTDGQIVDFKKPSTVSMYAQQAAGIFAPSGSGMDSSTFAAIRSGKPKDIANRKREVSAEIKRLEAELKAAQ